LFRGPLCVPLLKLPLPFLALEKGLNLREQQPGQGLPLQQDDVRLHVAGVTVQLRRRFLQIHGIVIAEQAVAAQPFHSSLFDGSELGRMDGCPIASCGG